MKLIVTGSLGHISLPLTEQLVANGHQVSVVSSNPDKVDAIEALGAEPLIGSLEDTAFLSAAFKNADAVYTMVPPNNYFDHSLDLKAYYEKLGSNYRTAIIDANVKRVVNLSSIGANLEKGSGILIGAHNVEGILNSLPADVSISHIRPTSFYYNLYAYVDAIKNRDMIAANYAGDDIIPWVSPFDIADVIAEELTNNFAGRNIRYVCSEELSCSDTARIIGDAIGKPGLKWNAITDEQMEQILVGAGMNPKIASGLVEMYAGLHTGMLSKDYFENRPPVLGKVKLVDFAQEFKNAFR